MLKQVQKTIEEFHMIEDGDKIVIGVSGGADSMCLFTVLQELSDHRKLQLHVVHVNHLLRKEADEEEAYVREICEQKEIPCTVFRRNMAEYAGKMGCSVEEAGRHYRYECFEQVYIQENCQKIAVAHHQNDRAETMLFHMVRGTGLRGLGSIPAVRGEIIRPLLYVSRKEIEAYLEQKQVRYYIDASNYSGDYTRNVIRNQVLPLLENMNEQAVSHITEVSNLAQEYWAYVEHQAEELEASLVKTEKNGLSLNAQMFVVQPKVLQRHLLYRMLAKMSGSLKDIEQQHVEQILELLNKPVGKQVSLPYEVLGIRTYNGLEIRKNGSDMTDGREKMQPVLIKIPGETRLDGIGMLECTIINKDTNLEISKNLYTKMLDYGKIYGALCIRNPMPGDYFIVNRQGERKKLSRFFIDSKIPKEERESVLVLATGSQICWIIGMRISEDLIITNDTEKILQISFQYEGEKNG